MGTNKLLGNKGFVVVFVFVFAGILAVLQERKFCLHYIMFLLEPPKIKSTWHIYAKINSESKKYLNVLIF